MSFQIPLLPLRDHGGLEKNNLSFKTSCHHQLNKLTEYLDDHHDHKPDDDCHELQEPGDVLGPLSTEDLEHDDVDDGAARDPLQGGRHDWGDGGALVLRDHDPDGNAHGAHEAVDCQVGEEQRPLDAVLEELEADAE